VAVVVCASTGDGDVPENAAKFLKYLKKSKGASNSGNDDTRAMWSRVHFAVLCLGDTNYENFCGGGRKIAQGIKDLGADEFYPRGMADDGTGLEQVVDPWIDGLWPALNALMAKHVSTAAAAAGPNDTSATTEAVEGSAAAPAPAPVPVPVPAAPTAVVDDAKWKALVFPLTLSPSTLAAKDKGAPDSASLPRLPTSSHVQVHYTASAADVATVPFNESSQNALSAASIVSAQVLTAPGALKRTLWLDVQLDSESAVYQPGDSIGVMCPNQAPLVDALLARLGYVGEQAVSFTFADGQGGQEQHLVRHKTVRDVLLWGLDLLQFPKKVFFRVVAQHARDEGERNMLLHLSSRGGSSDYSALRNTEPTLLDVLALFPSCNPPFAVLCDQLLPLTPRYYSVASATPQHAIVAFNVVQYTDEHKRQRRGLCTSWLDSAVNRATATVDGDVLTRQRGKVQCSPPIPLSVFLRKAHDFYLPSADGPDAAAVAEPLIFVGPGTGVAPFIGFLHELRCRRQHQHQGHKTLLFYGCRDPALDYLFQADLEGFVADGTLGKLSLSSSRTTAATLGEGWHQGYVQAAMLLEQETIAQWMLHDNGRLYVCGDAVGMLKGVTEALERIVTKALGGGDQAEKDARLKIQEWRETKRFAVDVWA